MAILSDAKRLKQILINLVGNAIKFTREGRVNIRVHYGTSAVGRSATDQGSGENEDDSLSKMKHFLHFDVIDTGIGMTADQQERLFKPFSQGGASVTRNFGGTGLGLAISQRLAEMLGGTITASSTEGVGRTFTVSIETGEITASNLINYNSEGTANATEMQAVDIEPTKLSCHVLIVDDRRDIRFLVDTC